jgi:vancomycin resistance protein YoaR
MIAPFLRDPAIQAESDAAFKAVSAQDLRDARNEAATKDVDSTKMSMADYRQLARQAGMKGSAVNAMAKQMQQEAETKAKKAETDIAATEALITARSAPKATTVEKDLADIESRFGLVGVPFRNPDGTLTQAAEEAILAKGRIGETSTLGSGLTLTDELARPFLDQANGDKEEARRLAKEQGYTVS